MANIGYVTSRRTLRPEKIGEILNRLNQTQFKGVLKIEASADDSWAVHCPLGSDDWTQRQCWLDTRRKFKISHGGRGGAFVWWVDFSISNAVALEYDGMITDDGIPDRMTPSKDYFPTFSAFLREHYSHVKPDVLRFLVESELSMTPPEFQDEAQKLLNSL